MTLSEVPALLTIVWRTFVEGGVLRELTLATKLFG